MCGIHRFRRRCALRWVATSFLLRSAWPARSPSRPRRRWGVGRRCERHRARVPSPLDLVSRPPAISRCTRPTVAMPSCSTARSTTLQNCAGLGGQRRAPAWRGHSDTKVLLALIVRAASIGALEQRLACSLSRCGTRRSRAAPRARSHRGKAALLRLGRAHVRVRLGVESAARASAVECREVDRGALALFMRHNYVPAPYSIYRGISKLLPGHC